MDGGAFVLVQRCIVYPVTVAWRIYYFLIGQHVAELQCQEMDRQQLIFGTARSLGMKQNCNYVTAPMVKNFLGLL